MPDPLPSDVVISLKTDSAALAAALILAGSFPGAVAWALKVFGGKDAACSSKAKANDEGAGRSDGAKPRAGANGGYTSPKAAAKHDRALLKLMRANPEASFTELIRMNGRPRNSTVSSLQRLEKAGLVEHAGRSKWTAVDPDLIGATSPPPANWTAPLSAKQVACHAADGRVRDEMTLA
jgi:hypothetical protein